MVCRVLPQVQAQLLHADVTALLESSSSYVQQALSKLEQEQLVSPPVTTQLQQPLINPAGLQASANPAAASAAPTSQYGDVICAQQVRPVPGSLV